MMPAEHQIFQNGHALKQSNILECPGNSGRSDFMGRNMGNIMFTEIYAAPIDRVDAIDQVDQGSFTGPVGSDNGPDFFLFNLETEIGEGHDPPEAFEDIFDFKNSHYYSPKPKPKK